MLREISDRHSFKVLGIRQVVRHGILIPALRWFESSMSSSGEDKPLRQPAWVEQGVPYYIYHLSVTAMGIMLGVGIAHTSGYVAVILFSEVVALSRKLRYALYCVVECLSIRLITKCTDGC